MKTKKYSTDDQDAHALYEVLAEINTKEAMGQFLEDLCTPAERQAMIDRWRVVPLIKEGIPYRTIHDRTGVSVTTIGRVARSLISGAGGYELAWQLKKG